MGEGELFQELLSVLSHPLPKSSLERFDSKAYSMGDRSS